MPGHRRALVAALVFGLCVATLDAAPAKQFDGPRFAVIVNDYAGVAPAVLESAKAIVTVIYRAAGVDVDWIDRGDPRLGDDEVMKSIVTISLYSAEMTHRSRDPEPVVGRAATGGRTVRVLYDRLEDIRGGRSSETAFLLGNVIAHEVGHLVLPAGSHSSFGLMAPAMSISLATSRPLFFTGEQSRIIRNALATPADH
jgi:hypothetical protein